MSEASDIQQNNEQILNDIQYLQQTEQQMFHHLETNQQLTTEQQKEIIEKINKLSTMRISLYKTLSGVNQFFQNALTASVGTLQEQTAAISIIEHELNESKKRLEVLEMEKNNKIRLVEINDYYGDKYTEHTKLMKLILFVLIPVIVLAILNNKGFLPNFIYYILVSIISLIGAVFFWRRFASIIMRDNMNYQEYDWYFNAKNVPTNTSSGTSSASNDPWKALNLPGTCIGQSCCSTGLTWDSSMNQCIYKESTVDGFSMNTNTHIHTDTYMDPMNTIQKALTKTSGYKKSSYTMDANNKIKPHFTESFIYKK
jgi:hypothetical protein